MFDVDTSRGISDQNFRSEIKYFLAEIMNFLGTGNVF